MKRSILQKLFVCHLPFVIFHLASSLAWAHSPEEAMRLGEKFMTREEWYRAATFFEEAALESTGETAQRAWLRAADANRSARQYEKAAQLYAEAATYAERGAALAEVRTGQSLFLDKKYLEARQLLTKFEEKYANSPLRTQATSYRALSSLNNGEFNAAAKDYRLLAERAESPAAKDSWNLLAARTANINELPQKSVRLAAALSIIPGLGQVYTGHYGEAAMAFVVNAAVGLLFWDYYLKARDIAEEPHRGWAYTTPALIGFFGSSFYLGNIYGAAVSAQRYNKMQVDKERNAIRDATVKLRVVEIPLDAVAP